MFSNNPYNIPLFKNSWRRWVLMEEEPRSIPMTRQADLSRMPDSRIVRPIRWDPSAMVNCSILTSCVVCSLSVWAFYIARPDIGGNVQDRHLHRLLPICQMDRDVLLLGNINPLFSPNDRYDVDIAFLAEVEFLQGFPMLGSSALLQNRLNEGRVPVGGWQTVGWSELSARSQFSCGEVTEKMSFHQDGLSFQPFG